jgi:hypothetical protein
VALGDLAKFPLKVEDRNKTTETSNATAVHGSSHMLIFGFMKAAFNIRQKRDLMYGGVVKQEGQFSYNTMLRRARAAVVAVEEESVLLILSVCL